MKGRIISKKEGMEIIMMTPIIMEIMKVINNKVNERNKIHKGNWNKKNHYDDWVEIWPHNKNEKRHVNIYYMQFVIISSSYWFKIIYLFYKKNISHFKKISIIELLIFLLYKFFINFNLIQIKNIFIFNVEKILTIWSWTGCLQILN